MIVNLAYIDDILNPLVGGADDDELVTKYRDANTNNEEQVRTIIRQTIKPVFESKNDEYKIRAKTALAYCLVGNEINFVRIFQRNLLPFDQPKDAKTFFIWLWRELFDDEILKLDRLNNYEPIFDLDELLRYLR